MHLITIAAYLAVFWQAGQKAPWLLFGPNHPVGDLVFVLAQPIVLAVLSWVAARRAGWLLSRHPVQPELAQSSHHRSLVVLRCLALVAHLTTVFCTRWPEWWSLGGLTPAVQIVGDLMVLSPFFLSLVAIWLGSFKLERSLHAHDHEDDETMHWKLGHYLDFNLRHHVLVVAVPLTLVLFASNVTSGYAESLQSALHWSLAPEALLGIAVVAVFVFAPVMLCRIWRTAPLPQGLLREQLESICERIGLHYREILVWHSDKMMINAAVMGVFAPVRYILLSDALLETMNERQVEAVFGHEAGHIKKHHVPHFLLFAFVGWLLVAALMELLARTATAYGSSSESTRVFVQVVGLIVTILIWGLGFGWLSRRFEREADLFGADCITPSDPECRTPCSIHNNGHAHQVPRGAVCSTGAAVFNSALDRVARLNGIPHEERSWRHSSIGSRIRFLTSLAADPGRANRFRHLLRRIRKGLITTAILGSAACALYLTIVDQPAIVAMQAGTATMKR